MDRLSPAAALTLTVAFGVSASSFGLVQPYSSDFEQDRTSASALSAPPSSLVTFMNVWADASRTTYQYGYGVFPAPNDIAAPNISVITEAADGLGSGQALSFFNDYNNRGEHAPVDPIANPPSYVETNLFLEQTIDTANIGQEWTFAVDAAKPATGAVHGVSGRFDSSIPDALVFIKTIDPNNGFATTNFLTAATDDLGAGVESRSLTISLDDPALAGQLLQVGVQNTAFQDSNSGVLYDNWSLTVPEPASLTLVGVGAFFGVRRRR